MMRVHSIFTSLDGEVNRWGQGVPSVFVRLQGCNLRCSYCDIPEAQEVKDDNMTVDEVVAQVWSHLISSKSEPKSARDYPKVTITGGEPLLQEDEVHELLNLLFPYGIRISIETNGTISLDRFRNIKKPNPDVCLVVDYKLPQAPKIDICDPGWDWVGKPRVDFSTLCEWDWIKFVLRDRLDYAMSKKIIDNLNTKAHIAFSPVHETLPGNILAQWILDDRLWNVTLNLQLHKYLAIP